MINHLQKLLYEGDVYMKNNNMIHHGGNGGGIGFCGIVLAVFLGLCLFAIIG